VRQRCCRQCGGTRLIVIDLPTSAAAGGVDTS
jgi:hypothetical protein